jgi:tryptophan synthase alpha subunit
VVEIGVPFTDPTADGTTIQRASHAALACVSGFIIPDLPYEDRAEVHAGSPPPTAERSSSPSALSEARL